MVQAKGEWGVAADLFEWFAEEAKRAYGRWVPSRSAAKRQLVIRQPVGVVGLITAWNFPAYNVARAAAAALAAGCTIVIRPSEFTPLTAMEMVNILMEAGIGDGAVNLINGEPESMGQEMLRNPKCAKIHFTGQSARRKIVDGRRFEVGETPFAGTGRKRSGADLPGRRSGASGCQRGGRQIPEQRAGVHFSAALSGAQPDRASSLPIRLHRTPRSCA